LNYLFLVTVHEKIDRVTVERVEYVGEEDCIEIKTEEDYVQVVWAGNNELEVSVLF
jgi:hypothetical protein